MINSVGIEYSLNLVVFLFAYSEIVIISSYAIFDDSGKVFVTLKTKFK